LGIEGKVPEGELWQKSVELFRDLAQDLGLPDQATALELKERLGALMAGGAPNVALKEELAALKVQLREEATARSVKDAILAGKIAPAQREWALSYCRREPESFRMYVDKAPRVVPVGERLNLGEERGRGDEGLTPEELAVCRTMNLTPEAYSQAKARLAQAK
jgi:phage I-like protein